MACISGAAPRVSLRQPGSCFLGAPAKLRAAAPSTASFRPARQSSLSVFALADGITVKAKEANAQGQIEVDVKIAGAITQSEFDKVLKELGTNSPNIPGYRRQKGGKNAKVPKQVLINMFGKKRLYGFVIDGLVSNTLLDYANEENLETEKEAKVTQDTKQLMEDFAPGQDLEFNAMLQLVGDFEDAPKELDDAIDVEAEAVPAEKSDA